MQLLGILLYPWMETLPRGRAVFGAFGLLVLGVALRVVKRSPWLTWLALVLAVILAAVTLAYAESARAFIANLLSRVTGSRAKGEHYMDIIGATVRSVANGVIGVAFVQALLCGIGFFLVGIPGAGLLSLLAMALGVVQIPVVLVTLPAIIYAFAVKSTTVAILFTVWFVIAGTR